jgi:hypothetical protein
MQLCLLRQTGYGLDYRGVGFLVPVGCRMALGLTQPPIKWLPEVKRQGREVARTSPTNSRLREHPLHLRSSWFSLVLN